MTLVHSGEPPAVPDGLSAVPEASHWPSGGNELNPRASAHVGFPVEDDVVSDSCLCAFTQLLLVCLYSCRTSFLSAWLEQQTYVCADVGGMFHAF
jgi:hypothetical protein